MSLRHRRSLDYKDNMQQQEPKELQKGNIVVAEDFPIVMNVIKNQIAELGMTEQCSFCHDGQEAINIAFKLIKAAIAEKPTSDKVIRPIDLMILDFQMPRKNGLDVV